MLGRFKSRRQENYNMNGEMLDRFKIKNAPSHYPKLLFYSLQVLQFISAVIVTVIMIWFTYQLHASSMAVPWKFIFLLTVSILTILALTANFLAYITTLPPPRHNAIINAVLLLLWITAFTILANAMKWTLRRACGIADWDTDIGMTVCRIYKVLFAFALTEIPVTFLALSLDIVVRRQETSSGAYMRTVNSPRAKNDPYSESKRLTENMPSLKVSSAGYGLQMGEKVEAMEELQLETEPLRDLGLRGSGMAYKSPSLDEKRYDDDGEDMGHHRPSGESVRDIVG